MAESHDARLVELVEELGPVLGRGGGHQIGVRRHEVEGRQRGGLGQPGRDAAPGLGQHLRGDVVVVNNQNRVFLAAHSLPSQYIAVSGQPSAVSLWRPQHSRG